jgi:hypothetical protein
MNLDSKTSQRHAAVTHRVLLQLGFFFFLNVASNFSHFETYIYLQSERYGSGLGTCR